MIIVKAIIPLYSYAKLKIFYIGQTGDKRLFTKEFSDNLLKSLPYVPVVGYYSEEEEDFVGHQPRNTIYLWCSSRGYRM
jgi:hypothetical protein